MLTNFFAILREQYNKNIY